MEGENVVNIETESIDNGLKKAMVHKHGNKDYDEYTNNEIKAYGEHIKTVIPEKINLDLNSNIYSQLRDGIILSYFMNHLKMDSINMKNIVDPIDMSRQNGLFEATANLSKVLRSAEKIGIVTVNIGPEDLLFENKSLILGLLWQMVKLSVTNAGKIKDRPEIVTLLNKDEDLNDIIKGNPEDILLRWINYHLMNAQKEDYYHELRRVSEAEDLSSSEESLERPFGLSNKRPIDYIPLHCTNFGKDLKDSKIYLIIMKQVAPNYFDNILFFDAYFEQDLLTRAKKMLEIAEKLNCKKFVKPEDIVAGDARLNFLFMATIFNNHIGIKITQEKEVEKIKSEIDESIKKYEEKCSEIAKLKLELDEARKNTYSSQDLEIIHKKNIEARKEIYEEALKEYNNSIGDFATEIFNLSNRYGYICEDIDDLDFKSKIRICVNQLINEIERARVEKKEAEIRQNMILEIQTRIEKKIDDMNGEKKRKSCLGFFLCK